MAPSYVKVGGAWKTIKKIYQKVSGGWQAHNFAYVKVAGSWELVFGSAPIPGNMVVFLEQADVANAVSLGWALCDGTNGTPDYTGTQVYFKVAATEAGLSGATTHAHDALSIGTAQYEHPDNSVLSGKGAPIYWTTSKTHNHGSTAATPGASPNDFYRQEYKPYLASSTTTQATKLPKGAIFFSNISMTSVATAQSKNGAYVKTTAATGGYTPTPVVPHTHALTATMADVTVGITSKAGAFAPPGPNDRTVHNHDIDTTTGATSVNPEGPWYCLDGYVLDADESTVPTGFMTFFAGSDVPDGYTYFSAAAGRYIKRTTATLGIGNTGDNSAHTHASKLDISEDVGGYALNWTAYNDQGIQDFGQCSVHRASAVAFGFELHHPISVPATTSTAVIPRTRSLMFLRRD